MPRQPRRYQYYPISLKKAKKLLQRGYSFRRIQKMLSLFSKSTISTWKTQKFDKRSVLERLMKKSHPLLTPFEMDVAAGWIVFQNIKQRHTSSNGLLTFLESSFGVKPKSSSWLNQFCKKCHLSYQQTASSNFVERSSKKKKQGITFLNYVRGLNRSNCCCR